MRLDDAWTLADLLTDSRVGPLIVVDVAKWHRLAVKHYGSHPALVHLGHMLACVALR